MLLTNICKFKSCGEKFPTLHDLIVHIEDTHINRNLEELPDMEQVRKNGIHMSYILPSSILQLEIEGKSNSSNSPAEIDVVTIGEMDVNLLKEKCVSKHCKEIDENELDTYNEYFKCYCGKTFVGQQGLNMHKRMKHNELSNTRKRSKRKATSTNITTNENVLLQQDSMQPTDTSTVVTIPLSKLSYQQHVRDRVIIPKLRVQEQQQHEVDEKLPVNNSSPERLYFNVLKDNNFCINTHK